jgi:beta-glucosidase
MRYFLIFLLMPLASTFAQYGPGHSSSSTFPWPEGKKAAISLTFDDARVSQVDQGIPLLDKYGIKATFYVSPPAMLQRTEGWKQALKNGHEVGNHSLTHPCTGNFSWARNRALEDQTITSIEKEMEEANRIIRENLGVVPVSFAYPCGQKFVGQGVNTRSYVPLVADKFKTGRGWLDEGPNDPFYCDLAQLTGMPSDNQEWPEIKALIDEAVEKGRWLVLAGHEMADQGNQTTYLKTLEALSKYVAQPESEIWVAPVEEIAAYVAAKRKEMQYGSFKYFKNEAETERKVQDLISRMTLEEKIGQLNMPCGYVRPLGKTIPEKMENSKRFVKGELAKNVGPGGGFFTLPNNMLKQGPRQQAEFLNELQRIALEETRLKIPLLQTEEGTHGYMATGGTIFPEGMALGSTWNMDLIRKIYEAAAEEARSVGVHQLFTLVIEPVRDPRLGRNIEAYSEDPYLTSVIAENIVQAVQGDDISAYDKVVAGLCHYPGQSEPVGGLERGAMEISERKLREVFLPSWEAGIKKAGALGVMATYPAINGVPLHSSKPILTSILRDELNFRGLVLSEGGGIETMIYENVAKDMQEAGQQALQAGLDVGISYESGFMEDLYRSYQEGKVSMEDIDRSVARVLRIKYALGLFDNPMVDPERAEQVMHNQEHQQLALEAARESIVLLKNDNNILPLDRSKLKSIAVIGPNADDVRNQLGDYVADSISQEVVTVLDGIRREAGNGIRVDYVKGCNVKGEELNEIERAVKVAKKADLVILVLGENEWRTPGKMGTSGEAFDVATLELTGLQLELAKQVVATGKPVVGVLVNGRPLAVPWLDENLPALVETWASGEKGGIAVAEVLFGKVNPSGKLPVTFPRHAGQLPVYYNSQPSKKYWLEEGWGLSYTDISPEPLYAFGHGLSYTEFKYSNLRLQKKQIGSDQNLEVRMDLKNTGNRAGAEIAQLYIHDKQASVTTPVMELQDFAKVQLEPGQTKEVVFSVTPEKIKLLNRNMDWVVEPGTFEVMVGPASNRIVLKDSFEVKE